MDPITAALTSETGNITGVLLLKKGQQLYGGQAIKLIESIPETAPQPPPPPPSPPGVGGQVDFYA